MDLHTFRFKTASGRWYGVSATNDTIRELILGGPKGQGGELRGVTTHFTADQLPQSLKRAE